MKLEEILTEEVVEEVSLRRGLAAGALAAGLAAAPHAAKADTTLTQHDAEGKTSVMRVADTNSPEYNQKMYPVYQEMFKNFMETHPNLDMSFARDIVRNRWIAKYHTQPPAKPQ